MGSVLSIYMKRDSIYTGWWHQHFAARCADNAVFTEKIITTTGAFTPAASEMRNAPMTHNSYIEKPENMTCVGLEGFFCLAVVKLDMPNA